MINRPDAVRELLDTLLDRSYERATEAALRAIATSTTDENGIIQRRLAQLDAEVQRLSDAGERMTTDNATLRALVADLDTVMQQNATRVDDAATLVTEAGIDAAGEAVRQLALPGLDDRQLIDIGLRWNTPDAEAVARLVRYSDLPAWSDELAKYAVNAVNTVNQIAIRGIVAGRNPLAIAREIRTATGTLPIAAANNLMRTLQLESYRSATVAYQVANADILTEQIRIGTLDDRICLCCLSLHGSRMPIGAKIRDHHQGRCTSIAVVRGMDRTVITGAAWFDGLAEDRQRLIAGDTNFEALQSGRVKMSDFVQPYTDPVFDEMIREASLKNILGEDARQFYRRNQ